MTQILSIQSSVSYGYVGNSAACFALQRSGHETLPVYTVCFSNHTGYETTRGPIIAAEDIRQILLGIDERSALDTTDALLAGYLGSAEIGQVICETVDILRQRNPKAIFCCDPVMGDSHEGFYTPIEVREQIRDKAIPRATITTPNLFELEYLSHGRRLEKLENVLDAMAQLRDRGPKIVLTTSVVTPEMDPSTICMIAQDDQGSWIVTTPKIHRTFTGSGDLTSATFLSAHLRGMDLQQACSHTASVLYSLLRATDEMGRDELALIQAQDQLINPTYRFQAEKIS